MIKLRYYGELVKQICSSKTRAHWPREIFSGVAICFLNLRKAVAMRNLACYVELFQDARSLQSACTRLHETTASNLRKAVATHNLGSLD